MKANPRALSYPKYRADIDGLRAIAVLSVIGFHAFPKLFKGGFIGVDVFFVISGFLISTILFESLERETFSFIDFYRKRIKRIFPALLLILSFCVALGWFVLLPDEYTQLGKHIAGGAGFISNFLLWNESGYFDAAAETKPLLHLWSLGIEEQFYIIWPLLLWVTWKNRINLPAIIMIIALSSFILNLKNIHSNATAVFYSPQTRFWELLSGSLLAWLILYKQAAFAKLSQKLTLWISKTPFKKWNINTSVINHSISVLGFLFIEYGIYQFTKVGFPGIRALLPTVGAVLIILAGTQAWINRVILSNRILIWLGLISFPLYLWHWPLLAFARIIEDEKPNKKIRIAAVIISIVLAWLTYLFIEKPIRFGNRSNQFKAVLLLILMSFMGCVGSYIYMHQGFKSRFTHLNDLNALVNLMDHPYPSGRDYFCAHLIPELKELDFDGGCRLSKESAPTVLFLGDSHTAHYYNAVWTQFPQESVLMIVQTSCLPFSSNYFLQGECKKKFDAVLSFLKTNSTIKKIYLSGYWAYLMSGGFGEIGERWRHAKALDKEGARSFKENGKYFLTHALKTNKEIIFLKDIPDLNFNIKSCFKIRPFQFASETRKECWIDVADYSKRVADYDKIIDELLAGFPQIKVYDPRTLLCNNQKCLARDDKLPYYFNGDHLNHYGAEWVIKDLLSKQLSKTV
ncbi:acyltransferase family protein [Legionella maceachernii]|uniref:O-antigen acetylase n=1 Tax=Legionella maceachernii TaxID=466 RepID=A0A0W0W080_9GAMM|nr:acyltransferase family protein [Legionella maceachernii]KTD25566.1 O-antigen acetylase [Legionella maceachernii]SJZ56314.1 Peptidoglycan/LPS O-acetylase OafA/YrhL, contains acyltransferase and SGNH-hydrolase domains [Legionella maceachernii]SUP00508.1 O-acetyltransferase OatA [Legionella maceachernii]